MKLARQICSRKKLFLVASALAIVACIFLLILREPGHLEPLVPDCPIKWATASYGTEHRFHTFRGRPFRFSALGALLLRLQTVLARFNGGRSILGMEGSVGHQPQNEPSLVIRVLTPPLTAPSVGCLYRVTVSDKRGVLAVSSGCGQTRTIEDYRFTSLPINSAEGLTVEFSIENAEFPTNKTPPPIARLKL